MAGLSDGPIPTYDGLADWYDETYASYSDLDDPLSSSSQLKLLLGPGTGNCLDIACGSGLHHAAITSTGRAVIGLDLSTDQLRIARKRMRDVVRGDVRHLPFPDSAFPAITCTFLHTDIDHVGPVFHEVRRVLAPGGTFVYLGVHPCFWGHFIESPGLPDRVVHPGYLDTGWVASRHWRSPMGLRARVGARHATISELINSLIATSLTIVRVEELGSGSAPGHSDKLAFVATRPT